jgi:hypothetical protein
MGNRKRRHINRNNKSNNKSLYHLFNLFLNKIYLLGD